MTSSAHGIPNLYSTLSTRHTHTLSWLF